MASLSLLIIVSLVVLVASFRLGHKDPAWLTGETPGPWCGGCGYSLHGHPSTPDHCPECGVATAQVPIVTSRIDFRRNMRSRLWRWTWRFLGGFALFCFLLLPDTSFYRVRASGQYLSLRENSDLPYVNREFTIDTTVTRWWLGCIPVWRSVEPYTLRCSEQREMPNTDNDMFTDTTMSIDPDMVKWRYTLKNGAQIQQAGNFNSDDILAWLKDSGIPVEPQQTKDEAAFLAECTRNLALHPRFTPAKQPFQSYGVRMHVPLGSASPLPPLILCLPCVAISLFIWYRGALRIRRRIAPIKPERESG
jgi:hypothetical protein